MSPIQIAALQMQLEQLINKGTMLSLGVLLVLFLVKPSLFTIAHSLQHKNMKLPKKRETKKITHPLMMQLLYGHLYRALSMKNQAEK